jgi:2,4-dienoyl-CoA reductase-like NADH-dependent reductase (Old Yellow Enzyme family)/thioredoxin reductase
LELKYLFSPGNIGTLTLKNRIILPAMGSGMPEKDGYVSKQLIDFHLARVKGGCGLNIIENSAIREDTKAPHVVGIYDDRFLPGLTELTGKIHEAGGKACIQIWHAGRQTRSSLSGHPVIGPSPIPCPVNRETPKEVTVAEIKDLVNAFADAADRAKRAGFDAVEIHGAHGYIVTQFMSPFSNKRSDEYGGTLSNRIRFPIEVITAIRQRVGREYPVLFRMSVEEMVDGGLTMKDSKQIAPMLEKAGVDAIHISMGNYASIQYVIPPVDLPVAFNVENSAAIKQTVSIPVITAGRINDPMLAENILQAGKADFISIGRGQLADPEFSNKSYRGNYDDIVKCVACNQGCVDRRLYQMTAICCMRNPSCGREEAYKLTPAEQPKKIVVIGGGPAGLEVATTLKRRGHYVVLCEKNNRLGGSFFLAGVAPRKNEMMDAALQMGRLATKAGVEVRLETSATPELLESLNPQVVIIATGSTPILPKIPGIEKPHVFTSIDVLSGKPIPGSNVAVIGGGLVGVEVAELLLKQGKKITLVEMLPKIAGDLGKTRRGFSLNSLKSGGGKIFTDAKCTAIQDCSIEIQHDSSQEVLANIDTVVIAVGFKSDNTLIDYLKSSGREYHVIGDAHHTAKALDAIWEAAELARNI